MDLDRYVDDELAEERALGHASSDAQRGDGTTYPGDPDVEVRPDAVRSSDLEVVIGGQQTTLPAMSSPGRTDPAPGIVVIHENKGLVPYIENTARRLATEGFVAVAPDLLAPVGGTGSLDSAEAATAALKERAPEDMVQDLRAVADALAADERVDADRLAVIGFCFGGGLTWRVLASHPGLAAGVPFYGPPPPPEDLARIEAPVLAVYGETDERITSTLPTTQETMDGHNRSFESLVLPGAGHAFHNDTNPDRYHPEAAHTAWDHAVAFLHRVLDAPEPRVVTTPAPVHELEGARTEVARACRALVVAGVLGGVLGHVSLRHDERQLLVRCRGPRERGLRFTAPSDVHLVGMDGTPPDSDDHAAPNELPIHTAIMAARPEVRAVVHAHPPFALIAGLADLELPPMFGAYDIPATRLAEAGIPVFPRAALINDEALAGELVTAIGTARACLLRGHGIVTTGTSLAQAVVAAVQLETLARVAVELHRVGTAPSAIEDADLRQLPDLGGGFNDEQFYRYLLAELELAESAVGLSPDR